MINKKAIQAAPLVYRHSFVVRIWREVGPPQWRGRVQHAVTGETVLFRELDELSAFIEDRTGGWADQCPLGSEVSRGGIRLR
jgi:hypothetical protein